MNQRTRAAVVGGFVLLAVLALLGQAAFVDRQPVVRRSGAGAVEDETVDRGPTLVGVQSWDDEGRLLELSPNGTVRWEYSLDGARVFGIDPLRKGEPAPNVTPAADGTVVLFSLAEIVPATDCEAEFIDAELAFRGGLDAGEHCVNNRVVLMDRPAKEVVWQYSWYDEMVHYHEVHDAEVTDDGEVVVVDMGNDRAFTVDEDGEITWEWQAEEHIDEGTAFFEKHVPAGEAEEFAKAGELDDWTHMNDIDQLPNGNFQLSIRNYDMLIEVDPETDEIVDTLGEPGKTEVMSRQHDPQPLPSHGTTIVADSDNDRVIEVDDESEEVLWEYTGPPGAPLQWPRDADRLPNGHTLITDSRNNRILEINASGRVVWEFHDPNGEVIPLPYGADRLPMGETAGGPSADELDEQEAVDHGVGKAVRDVVTVAHWVLPTWMHLPQQLNLLAILLGGLWLLGEGAVYGYRHLDARRRVRNWLGGR